MSNFWHFPSTIGGDINSINNAGLETFRGNALESLTREICQNSLDAVKDNTKPVIVEFKDFTLDMNDFPNRDELINAFQSCETTWKDRNKKSEEFIERALSILHTDTMQVLRISDFNTKGLEGAKDAKLGSPWSSLIREAGSSNKGDSSGGSFGIGKSAPFLNSNLRTLFYSSYDIEAYESFIGVSNILSFKLPTNEVTVGKGYYTNNELSTAIPGQLHLDKSYQRMETGTDIYVTAFNPKTNWETEMVESVLYNFFITIWDNRLIVKVNDFEINKDNIIQLINELENNKDNQVLKDYAKILTSDRTIKIPYPEKNYKNNIHFKAGEAELYLFNGTDLNRKVLMTRKTGMRIFEQNRISGSISFTGILRITGKNMNTVFKEIENPEHNKWEPNRYEKDRKLADRIFADLRRFIRETVKELFQEKITKEMDAVGLGDFLPNTSLLKDGKDQKKESLTTKVKELVKKEKVPKRKKRKKSTRRQGQDFIDIEQQLEGEFGITSGEKGGHGTGTHRGEGNHGGGISEEGGQNDLDRSKEGGLDKERKRRPSNKPIPTEQRYVCTDKEAGEYLFHIAPKKDAVYASLVFHVIGEQSDYKLPIKSANTDDQHVAVERIDANIVYLQSLKKNKSFVLHVHIDYSDYCVLEVVLYEN